MPKYRAFVHCSDSPWGTVLHINQWHEQKGWGDKAKGIPAIGYQAVIENGYPTSDHFKKRHRLRLFNGSISMGRFYDSDNIIEASEVGAHAYGHNRDSMAVCLIGRHARDFTRNQIISLIKLLQLWRSQFGIEADDILGHYEVDTHGKTCPNLDMEVIRGLVQNKSDSFTLMDRLNLKEVA